MTDQPIVALDTETTSLVTPLSRYGRRAWEFAAIRRDPDGTMSGFLAHVQPTPARMMSANEESLRIGGYHERAPWLSTGMPEGKHAATLRSGFQPGDQTHYYCVTGGNLVLLYRLGLLLTDFLHGVTIVGSNPSFDTENVTALLEDAGLPPQHLEPWSYKDYDIAAHGSSALGLPGTGPSTAQLSEKFGIQRPVEHTGLADAWWALAMHDAIEDAKAVRR